MRRIPASEPTCLLLAPCKAQDRDALIGSFVRVEGMERRALEAGLTWSWESTAEYAAALEQRLGLNVGFLVGHCAERQAVMGEDAVERAATPDVVAAMQALVRAGLDAGDLGFSTNQNERSFREDSRGAAPAGDRASAVGAGREEEIKVIRARGGAAAGRVVDEYRVRSR